MRLGIMLISNHPLTEGFEEITGWIKAEFSPFFKLSKELSVKEEAFSIQKGLNSFVDTDVVLVIGDLGLKKVEYTVTCIKKHLDTRILPLEDAMKYALVLKSGPLAALIAPVAGMREQSYFFAIPDNVAEIKTIISTVLKPFLLNHVFFDKIKVKPLDMLKEYLESG